MGIKGLNTLLRKYIPSVFSEGHISEFSGKNIAIDLPIVVMRHLAIQREKYIKTKINITKDTIDLSVLIKPTIKAIISELRRFKHNYSLGVVLVWEGTSSEHKFKHAGNRRLALKNKAKEKFIEALNSLGEDFEPSTEEDVFKYEHVTNLAKRYIDIPPGFYEKLEEILLKENYSIIKATGEAEELCSELCICGKVAAVYSTDTDCLVRRCPKLITKITPQGTINVTTYSDEILTCLKITYEQFVDLSILAECDYNTGIKGIGIMKAYKNILKHNNIEHFLKEGNFSDDTISNLNHISCRELFCNRSLHVCCIDLSPMHDIVILTPEILITPNK